MKRSVSNTWRSCEPPDWRMCGPFAPGKLFTSALEWAIKLDGEGLRIAMGGQLRAISVGELASLNVKPGIFWVTIFLLFANDRQLALDESPLTKFSN